MAQLVRDWDIDNDRFATTVIDVSRGVPLIAHAMCETARKKGRFGGEDIVDVLNSRIANRLAEYEHGARAVAVALALASSATGEELGDYATAVTMLPPVAELLPHLELLADVGIAQVTQSAQRSGQPDLNYSIKPDLLAAALLATSLNSDRGARIKVQELLNLIGLGDGDRSVGGEPHESIVGLGSLNTDPKLARVSSALAVHQVSLLAQAAAISGNGAVLDRLASTILASIPTDPVVADWTIVFRLTEQVVGYAPRLFGELQIALTKQPTLQPSNEPALWFESVEEVRRYEYGRLMSAAMSTVEHHGAADPAAATELALTISALLAPHVRPSQGQHGPAGKAVKALVAPRAGEPWADCIARRTRAIDAVTSWVAMSAPRNVPDNDQRRTGHFEGTGTTETPNGPGAQDSTSAALDALVALIDPIVEQTRMGSPESADVLVLSGTHLPEGDATEHVLREAAGAVAALFADLPLNQLSETPDALLRAFISLPRDLWGIGARGAPYGGGALPDSLRTVLALCGREIETVFAQRWAELPLWARYEIVNSVSHVRPVRTLKQRARQGSPVARAAIKDPDVARLLILAPTERDLRASTREASSDQRAAQLARQLAREVGLDEAVDLLRTVSVLKREWQMHDPMIVFVDEVAELAQEPVEVRALLAAAFAEPHMAGADRLVAQLAIHHPTLVEQALRTRAEEATTPGTLIDVIPQLHDGELRRALAERALEMIIAAQDGADAVTPEGIQVSEHRSIVDAVSGVVAGAAAAGIKVTTAILPEVAVRTAARPLRSVSRAAKGVLGAARRLGDERGRRPSPEGDHRQSEVIADNALEHVQSEISTLESDTTPQAMLAAARQWVHMTWRLPPEDSDVRGQSSQANGWRTDALIRMGLRGPAGAAGDVLLRATYRARRTSDTVPAGESEPTEPLSSTQINGLMQVLARLLSLVEQQGGDSAVSDWEHASAVVALAKLAPEQLSDVLAPWIVRSDGISRTWPMEWEHELREMATKDRVPFGVALKSRLDARLETLEFAEPRDKELAQFDVDRNLGLLLRDSSLWRATVEGWITGPSQDLGRATAVLAKSWRSEAWPELVDLMLAARPGNQLLTHISRGLLPSSYGPDLAEVLQPRLDAVARVKADTPAAQAFVEETTSRLRNFLDEYESDAERRRTGY